MLLQNDEIIDGIPEIYNLEAVQISEKELSAKEPERIEKRQLIVALIDKYDMLDPEAEIEATLNAIADDKERRVALAHWKHANEIPRRHKLALLLQAEWEWEDGKMDQLWIDASDA